MEEKISSLERREKKEITIVQDFEMTQTEAERRKKTCKEKKLNQRVKGMKSVFISVFFSLTFKNKNILFLLDIYALYFFLMAKKYITGLDRLSAVIDVSNKISTL